MDKIRELLKLKYNDFVFTTDNPNELLIKKYAKYKDLFLIVKSLGIIQNYNFNPIDFQTRIIIKPFSKL